MKSVPAWMLALAMGFAALAGTASGQTELSTADALNSAAQQQKFAFILFWRQSDSVTDAIAHSLEAELAKCADRATSVMVRIDDPRQRGIVDHFGVSRAPMPMVLAVAPNGAVTGVFRSALSAESVLAALVTPATANCMKAMQDGKTVLMMVHPSADVGLYQGTHEFLSDPNFGQRTVLVRLASNSPAETPFLQQLGVTAQEAKGCLVMMAPPGAVVGKFQLDVSRSDLVAKLHEAGKCCNDENCKHNR